MIQGIPNPAAMRALLAEVRVNVDALEYYPTLSKATHGYRLTIQSPNDLTAIKYVTYDWGQRYLATMRRLEDGPEC